MVPSQDRAGEARDKLSAGFRQALEILGQGFLSHNANTELRSALRTGELTEECYFRQLLRIVYRLVFLLTVEERNLLHPKSASESARRLYADGYAVRRLRDFSIRRIAHDHHRDLWEAVASVFHSLAGGEPRLGLPALSGLFASEECPDLDAAKLENRVFLNAIFHMAWLREHSGSVRVDWRDMRPDELGCVYEHLLELVPQITGDGRIFSFTSADESRGHPRKTTGSHRTPDELVQRLLASALDPVIERTINAHPENPADALLNLAIIDPACGSGHFLLAAARRLADRIARIRADGTPSPDDYRSSLRDVVRQCIYGVDRNPLAVEICKLGLWMESVDPGLPLTFLESHIRCGNSLIGTNRRLMGEQVPDAAWTVLEGDDRKVAKLLKRLNKAETAGQQRLPFEPRDETGSLYDAVRAVERASDTDAAALAKKQRQWNALLADEAYNHEKLVADAWCAAFLWPKGEPGPVMEAAPTTAAWRALRDEEATPLQSLLDTTRRIAEDHGFFHWELAFPQIFGRGGFDVVLGNPPWEHLKLQKHEFFAQRDPSIANAWNVAERKQLIPALRITNPVLWEEWTNATRIAQGQSHFARQSGRFPLCGKGDVNTYALFAEHNWSLLAPRGRAGFIVPGEIVTDGATKEYFQALLDRRVLASVWHFENDNLVFKGLHHEFRFLMLTIGESDQADFVFYSRRATDLDDQQRHFALTSADFAALNPNTRTCPAFRSRRDADINLAIYRRAGVLWREEYPDGNPWGIRFLSMFHMANNPGLFRPRAELAAAGWQQEGDRFEMDGTVMLPLYEAKMIHHFDHRFGSYEGQSKARANQGTLSELDDVAHADPSRVTSPRYWVAGDKVAERLGGTWDRRWLLGWRDAAGAGVSRTVIACITPRVAVNHTIPLMMPSRDPRLVAMLYANLSSIPFDYCARQKVGGLSLKYFTMQQLPVLQPREYSTSAPWEPSIRIRDWLLPRILELTYTAWNLKAFAKDCGDDGAPFIWAPERRFQLRCEIDAAFFHLYGVSREGASWILDTFEVLRRWEEHRHGEYRTKRGVLEIYDALAAAGGTPYHSSLGTPRRAT